MRKTPFLILLLALSACSVDAWASGAPKRSEPVPEVSEPVIPEAQPKTPAKKAESVIPEATQPVKRPTPKRVVAKPKPKVKETPVEVFWDDCPACGMG